MASGVAWPYSKHREHGLHNRSSCQPFRPGNRLPFTCITRAAAAAGQPEQGWWDNINRKRGIQGPAPPAQPAVGDSVDDQGKWLLGENGWRMWETIRKDEKQRVWDSMRAAARDRYQRGEMPSWFNPAWLDQEEAPPNMFFRESGHEVYQSDDQWLGYDGGDAGGSGRGHKRGTGWWREDDPYWMLRNWGDHPMRWWTLGFAGLLAAGGLMTFATSGYFESLQVGLGAAALLTVCSMAMSDMTYLWYGPLAVKVAWGICALLAIKEALHGWQHKDRGINCKPQLGACGVSCLAMCALYMVTGMSGLEEYALPMNPGMAFKLPNTAVKSRIWRQWGYGQYQLRG